MVPVVVEEVVFEAVVSVPAAATPSRIVSASASPVSPVEVSRLPSILVSTIGSTTVPSSAVVVPVISVFAVSTAGVFVSVY